MVCILLIGVACYASILALGQYELQSLVTPVITNESTWICYKNMAYKLGEIGSSANVPIGNKSLLFPSAIF
jgi:hypothetical protein